MRTFVWSAVLAAVGVVGSGGAADAQVVVGTRGIPASATYPLGYYSPGGYYSPYSGTLYSPFATGVTIGRMTPTVVPTGYYAPVYVGGDPTYHHHYYHGPAYTPYGGYSGGYRRW